MPIDYNDYADNWKSWIRPQILDRAENKCEFCGLENGLWGIRDVDGEFWTADQIEEAPQMSVDCPEKNNVFMIVLTIAHLDHDKENNDGMEKGLMAKPVHLSNLRALCQQCHLRYDAKEKARKRKAKAQGSQQEFNFE